MRIGPVDTQNDLWNQYLRLVLPHDRTTDVLQEAQLPSTVAPWSDVVSSILVTFSTVIITLAILWLIWQTVSSVVNAAWSGEAISREWHSIWGPLRIVLGLGLLAPVANGNNIAQLLVIQVSAWSGQAANSIYNATLAAVDVQNTNATSVLPDSEISRIVRNVAVIDLCSRSVRYFDNRENVGPRRRAGSPGQAGAGNMVADETLEPTYRAGSASSNSLGVTFYGHNSCPGLEISYSNPPEWLLNSVVRWAVGAEDQRAVRTRVRDVWVNALDDIADGFRPIGSQLMRGTFGAMAASGGSADIVQEFRQWETTSIQRWRQASEQAVAIIRESWANRNRRQGLEAMGWLNSPALLFQRTGMMRDAWAVANAYPSVTRVREFQASLSDAAQQPRFRRYDQMLTVLGDEINSPLSASERQAAEAGNAAPNSLSMQPLTRTAEAWGMIPRVDIRTGSPLMQVSDWGFWLMETGSIIWTASMAAQAGTNMVGTISQRMSSGGLMGHGTIVDVLSRGIGALASFATFLGGVMVFVGAMHAYVLPFMPTIIFIIFALSCLVLVVEALIAAPLWALGHIKLAGQGIVDQTQLPGYQILLNLFVRIPIAMMAFVFSLLVVDVGLHGVSQIMGYGFGVHASSVGPIGFVVFMLVYGFISWTICIRAFSMINELPDKVLRWIQIQSAANHDDGQRYLVGAMVIGMQRAGAATNAAAAAITSPVRSAASGGPGAASRLPAPGPASKLPRGPGS